MKFGRWLCVLVVGGIVCLWRPGWIAAGEVVITVLHTTDLHGHMEYRNHEGSIGGMLRCATLIRKIRGQEPNALLIDCGDLFQGSAESHLTQGQIIADAVKTLQYDAFVLGNHEFDWGFERLCEFTKQAGIPVLAANLAVAPLQENSGLQPSPFIVREFQGVRVIVVGLTNPLIPGWFRPRLLGPVTVEGSLPALRRIMPGVRDKAPDVMILAAHQGYRAFGKDPANEIGEIARHFPEFDVILGGHTHQAIDLETINRIPFTQAGCYGTCLGVVRLTYDTGKKRVIKTSLELMPVTEDIVVDEVLKRLVSDSMSRTKRYLSQTIGDAACDHPATSDYPGQSRVQAVIASAIVEATGAEVVFHGVLSDAKLEKGKISMADVRGIVPYENHLGVATLTLAEIREILEENSAYYETSNFRGIYGLTYELNPRAPKGSRVSHLRLRKPGSAGEQDRFAVAFNSYDMASGGRRYNRLREIIDRPSSRLNETRLDTREAVIEYIRKQSPLDVPAVEGAVIVGKKRQRNNPKRQSADDAP